MRRGTPRYSTRILPGVHRIILPLPGTKPGPVNVYLFIGQNVTLLDTGTAYTAGRLRRAIQELGLDFSDIDQIVLTHGHIDHYGAASAIIRNSSRGPCVLVHPQDAEEVQTGVSVPRKTQREFLLRMGLPLAYYLPLNLLFFVLRAMARNCRVNTALADGDDLMLGDYSASVIATPGHSPGSMCFFLEKQGAVFSGDHILGHITPNALVMLDKNAPLPVRSSQKEFYESLKKIEALKPSIVFPGHAAPIQDLAGIADMYRRTFSQRRSLVLSILDSGPMSVYGIAIRLFRDKLNEIGAKSGFSMDYLKRFSLEIYLSISEVYTHLQVLESEGLVTMHINNRTVTAEKNG